MKQLLFVSVALALVACGEDSYTGPELECGESIGRVGGQDCPGPENLFPPVVYSVRGTITIDGQAPASAVIVALPNADTATVTDTSYRVAGELSVFECDSLAVEATVVGSTGQSEGSFVLLGSCGSHTVDFSWVTAPPA